MSNINPLLKKSEKKKKVDLSKEKPQKRQKKSDRSRTRNNQIAAALADLFH